MWHSRANRVEPVASRLGGLRTWLAPCFGFAIFLLYGLCGGQAQDASEYQVKAAYLYNFAKSARWPEQILPSGAPLVIGVVGGDDEFIDTLTKTIAGKTAGTHPITAKRASSIADMDFCQMVFFRASGGRKRTEAAISALASASILLVGEDEAFLREGGMINLILKNGTVRFEMDAESLDRADIHVGPELLALATNEHSPSGSPPASAGTETRRLRVSAPPEYPEMARRMNIKGSVLLDVSVRRDGTVKDVKILGGHPLLADAAAKAVMGWRYEPASNESQIVVKLAFGQ